VLIPRVYWPQTAARTLALENVGFVKIGDFAALAAAGVDRAQVAKRLWATYLQQIVVHNFVHADPHPGNLFIKPLAPKSGGGPCPFQLAFVDFGMVAVIPERLKTALREYVIALGTRDAYGIVQAYRHAGMLLPGADLKRLEEAHEAIFERFWGVRMGDLRDRVLEEVRPFLREYRDLIVDYPFQAQVDLLFVQRAIEILIGMVTRLDPQFDLWSATRPFAERLAREGRGFPEGEWVRELAAEARAAAGLPRRFERVLTEAQRGNLAVRSGLAPDARKALSRLESAVARLSWMVAAMGFLVSGTLLWVNGAAWAGLAGMGLAGVFSLVALGRGR
jgi:predicted unusual protein kinase regulating ubiquinone biosynthesis (AarF/ABC1/UbiB family)